MDRDMLINWLHNNEDVYFSDDDIITAIQIYDDFQGYPFTMMSDEEMKEAFKMAYGIEYPF